MRVRRRWFETLIALYPCRNLPPLASTAGARENLDPSRGNLSGRRSAAGGDVDSLGRLIPSVADDDHLLDEGGENYRSLTDKKWGDFLEGGFDGLESSSGGLLGLSGGGSRGGRSSIAKKLEFDLTEGAKKVHLPCPRVLLHLLLLLSRLITSVVLTAEPCLQARDALME